MTRSNLEKFIFVGAIVFVVVVSHVAHYSISSGSQTGIADASMEGVTQNVSSSILSPLAQVSLGSSLKDVGDGFTTSSTSQMSMFVAPADDASLPFSRVGNAPVPAVEYQEALIADLESGAHIFGDNDAKRWPTASLTKLMNATIVLDTLDLGQKITITPAMFSVDPTEKYLKVGETYTISDLLRVMLLPSSNVAAEAFADFYGRTRFVALMNQRAGAWGMINTHYDDPSGLSASNQSTPDDLLLLAQKIYTNYPEIFSLTRNVQVTITEQTSGNPVIVKSINNFAGLPDFVGGKTGYTDQADGNLLSVFNNKGRPVLFIVLGTNDADRFTITQTLYNWFTTNYK
jgi:D-alanyl-D-alanine carboxypeptidase